MVNEQISQKEIDERVAILKRWKILLQQQRDKFVEYLTLLEKQESSIQSENTEVLMAQTEMEQQVLLNISNLRKVISPLEKLYSTKTPNFKIDNNNLKIPQLQAELESLQKKVLIQNNKNRELLKNHMIKIRNQIQSIKNPYRNNRSVYSSQLESTSKFVDVNV